MLFKINTNLEIPKVIWLTFKDFAEEFIGKLPKCSFGVLDAEYQPTFFCLPNA